MYVKGRGTGKITNKEYQEVCNTSERTSSRDLAASGLFEQIGTTGKDTMYVLRLHKAPQRRQNIELNTLKARMNSTRHHSVMLRPAGGGIDES